MKYFLKEAKKKDKASVTGRGAIGAAAGSVAAAGKAISKDLRHAKLVGANPKLTDLKFYLKNPDLRKWVLKKMNKPIIAGTAAAAAGSALIQNAIKKGQENKK